MNKRKKMINSRMKRISNIANKSKLSDLKEFSFNFNKMEDLMSEISEFLMEELIEKAIDIARARFAAGDSSSKIVYGNIIIFVQNNGDTFLLHREGPKKFRFITPDEIKPSLDSVSLSQGPR